MKKPEQLELFPAQKKQEWHTHIRCWNYNMETCIRCCNQPHIPYNYGAQYVGDVLAEDCQFCHPTKNC